jgi:hypothetical protein
LLTTYKSNIKEIICEITNKNKILIKQQYEKIYDDKLINEKILLKFKKINNLNTIKNIKLNKLKYINTRHKLFCEIINNQIMFKLLKKRKSLKKKKIEKEIINLEKYLNDLNYKNKNNIINLEISYDNKIYKLESQISKLKKEITIINNKNINLCLLKNNILLFLYQSFLKNYIKLILTILIDRIYFHLLIIILTLIV